MNLTKEKMKIYQEMQQVNKKEMSIIELQEDQIDVLICRLLESKGMKTVLLGRNDDLLKFIDRLNKEGLSLKDIPNTTLKLYSQIMTSTMMDFNTLKFDSIILYAFDMLKTEEREKIKETLFEFNPNSQKIIINLKPTLVSSRQAIPKNKVECNKNAILTVEEKNEKIFQENIDLIIAYLKETGKSYDQIKSTQIYHQWKMGKWIGMQKFLYRNGKLSKNRENQLRALGETFFAPKILAKMGNVDFNFSEKSIYEQYFDNMIELVTIFLKETEYNLDCINDNTMYHDVRIGSWMIDNWYKYQNKQLSPERIEKLRLCGMISLFESSCAYTLMKKAKESKSKRKTKYDQYFDDMIMTIRQYMKETGKSYSEIKETDEYNEVRIGVWKMTQRYLYNKHRLREDRRQQLHALGEDFLPLRIYSLPEKNISLQQGLPKGSKTKVMTK